MKSSLLYLCVALTALLSAPTNAQVARPGDRAVSEIIDGVQKSVNQFERGLDSDFKHATLRGAKTDVRVDNFLEDFNADIERLRARFKGTYSASADVAAVLHKATKVDAFIQSQPPSFKGRSDWDVAAAKLKELASAYETTFPTPGDASARRINDAEIEQAAETISREAKTFRKGLSGAFPKNEAAALATAQKSADSLSRAADTLKTRSRSDKPASGEAGVLAEALAATKTSVEGRTLPEPATAAWGRIETAAKTVAQAFRPAEG
jgi:hypothetical protein